MMKSFKKLIFLAFLLPLAAMGNEGGVALDKAHIDPHNQASLQNGAKMFVNYCMGCHSANYMRYNRLQEIGLTEKEIKDNLIFSDGKVGDTMSIAMRPRDGKTWFGATPPDLTVIARARGADWLYTYLRTFYRDDSRPTGWNNLAFDKVGMPHVLWELQGEQRLVETHGAEGHAEHKLVLEKPGKLTPAQYDGVAADLVNYLVFMGEPMKQNRIKLGFLVLAFLGIFWIVAYALKKEYWKDVH